MDAIQSAILLCSIALVAGCVAQPNPIIDRKGLDQELFDQDWAECEAYRDEIMVARGVAKGAGLGVIIGAASGAIGGNSTDAAQGAAIGGLQGGTVSGLDAEQMRQEVFKRCMIGRGYRVLN